ncbi:hypothetical protein JCM10207_001742 [Rhodosporidiobolus poonsookiae]
MFVQLGDLDKPTEDLTLTFSSVFRLSPEDDGALLLARLHDAAERVVRKWPMLAAIVQPKTGKTYAIDIPADQATLERPLVGFTEAAQPSTPYHIAAGLSAPLALLSSADPGFLPDPKMAFFRDPKAPKTLADYAKRKGPLLHIHGTLFSDALAVGIALPHGVFDGTACGMVLRAITSELKNEDWTPPPSHAPNPLQERLDQLLADGQVADAEPDAPSYVGWEHFSLGGICRLLGTVFTEQLWWKSERQFLFIPRATVDYLAKRTKGEVKELTNGEEYVSTNDALEAWFFKAAHSAESSSPATVISSQAFSVRTTLDTYQPSPSLPSLSSYPHNAAIFYPSTFPPLRLSALCSDSVGRLALRFRRSLTAHRTLAAIRASVAELRGYGQGIPTYNWPQVSSSGFGSGGAGYVHRWIFSSHLGLGLADLAIPGADGQPLPKLAYHMTADMPIEFPHALGMQDMPEGVIISGAVRRSRWQCVERALQELERERLAAQTA